MRASIDAGAHAMRRSFRDPAGVLIHYEDRILRSIHPSGIANLEAFLATQAARDAMESGRLVRSVRVPLSEFPEAHAEYLVEHERISFPSYPYEWPTEMLHAAGALTLDLAQKALAEGFILKDAPPYNVLFRGSDRVFVDVL